MARIESWFEQDLQKPITVRYLGGNVFSQDNMGNLIGVVLTNNGVDYSGGGTVSGNVIRNDGGTVALTGAITGNRAYVILPQAAYAVVGTVTIIIKLTVESEVATIAAVVSDVYASSTDVIIDPGTIIPSIANLIAEIEEAVDSIPLDWSELNQKVNNLKNILSNVAPMPIADSQSLTDGYAIAWSTGIRSPNNSASCSSFIDISGCERIMYTRMFTMGSSAPNTGIAFFDENQEYISGLYSGYGESAQTAKLYTIDVPANAKYIRATYWPSDNIVYQSVPFAIYNANQYKDSTQIVVDKIVAKMSYAETDNNLWSYGTINENRALNAITGELKSNTSFNTTDYIPVSPGDVIYGYGARFHVYNSEKTTIATGTLNQLDTEMPNGHYYTIPANAAYFRICANKTGTPNQFRLYRANLYEMYLRSIVNASIISGQKMYCLGDSITKGMYANEGSSRADGKTAYGYPYWIGEVNGYEVVNLGVSGSGYANLGTPEEGVMEDDSTSANAVDVVDNNTFDDADFIILSYGVNDWKGAAQDIQLGSMSSTAKDGTVIGNMKYCIETLISEAPYANIIVLLPMNTNRQWPGMAQMTLENNWAFGYAYRNNQTLQDYRNAIRECADYYNVKVIDLEEVCAINRINIRKCLGDGLHPTRAFYKKMGASLASLIR